MVAALTATAFDGVDLDGVVQSTKSASQSEALFSFCRRLLAVQIADGG
jgi:hypothetical protein